MPRPRTDIRPRIVRAARQRFIRSGVDASSLRRIAEVAGTSIGMIYYYFPSKDDLFLAVVEEVYLKLLADLEQALAPNAPLEERIRRLYLRIGSVSELELQVIRMVVREALVSSKRLDRLFERFQRGHLPLVLGMLAEGRAEGSLRKDVHPLVTFMSTLALGAFPQFMRRAAADRLPFADAPAGPVLSHQLLDVLLRGIGSPGPPKAAGAKLSPGPPKAAGAKLSPTPPRKEVTS